MCAGRPIVRRQLEGFIDAGDALRRRHLANRIYIDLVDRRISHARATAELLALTQQQKGGWLYDRLGSRIEAWHELVRDIHDGIAARLFK